MALTLSNLLTEVRAFLKEPTAIFWIDADLTRYLNDAIRQYTSRLGLYTQERKTSIIVNQEDYAMPPEFVIPVLPSVTLPPDYSVKIDGRPVDYLPWSIYHLVRGWGAGLSLGSTPKFYTFFNATLNAGVVANLKLYPVPTQTGTDNLVIGFPGKAPALSVAGDIPRIPEEDHEALAWGAAAIAFLQRGQTEEAGVYQVLFDRRILERLPGGGNATT